LSRFGCVPLNANELLLPAQRAELQELLCVFMLSAPITASHRHTKMSETVLPFMFKPKSDKDGETQHVECNRTSISWL